jgi:MarR family transcriptional regulator, 2-MHQ and catechol-resistance regulon repressor
MAHFKGTEEERRVLFTYIRLMRASETVTDRIHRYLSDYKLTPSQFGVLEALYHLGPLCQNVLGEKLLRSPGNITMVIDNLEKRELVKREKRQNDRRFYNILLTPEGEELINTIFPRHVKITMEEMNVLTPEEQEELGRLCEKLGLKRNNM